MTSKKNNKLISQSNNNIITEEQAAILVKQANYLNILDYMKEEQLIKQIDYETEKENFFKQCSKTKSNHTKRQYKNGLNKLEEYCKMNNKNILFIKAREADDFITEVNSSELSNLSIRALVSSCSSFFSFLERRYPFIKNPFRGTKTRPPVKNKKRLEVPTKKEIELIIKDISDPLIKVAIIFIMECGVRVGALPNLEIRNNPRGTHSCKYYSYSKGKEISWKVTDKVIKLLKQNNLSFNNPFKNKSSEVIRNIFYRSSKRLYEQGKIKAAYSIHDIRHYFAVTLYKQTKDIELIRQALNHSSIAITGIYLKSLEVE